MIPTGQKKRVLVPQWRTLSASLRSGELASLVLKKKEPRSGHIPHELIRRLAEWRRDPGPVTAAELIDTAIVFDRESEALSAARLIVRESKQLMPPVVRKAVRLLERAGEPVDASISSPEPTAHPTAYWRQRVKDYPRDALAWVELARVQIVHPFHRTESEKPTKAPAERSMAVALQLAPNNRFVLRAAARLFFHLGDKERARDIVRKSQAAAYDPWLMAAEIALAQSTSRPPSLFKKGLALLDQDLFAPRQTAELAGAIATSLVLNGNHKRGKRRFIQSLRDPTNSAFAQAEWASEELSDDLVSENELRYRSDADEALARHAFRTGKFEDALHHAARWAEQEEFSAYAYGYAVVAANISDSYARAEELARKGMEYNPRSVSFRNSLAFAIASQGNDAARLSEAETHLNQIKGTTDRTMALIRDANLGLIAYRRGQIAEGRAHYERAVAGFKKFDEYSSTSAMLYRAREAILAGDPDSLKFLLKAREFVKSNSPPAIHRLLHSTELLAISTTLDPSRAS